jgi:hypothetical protein
MIMLLALTDRMLQSPQLTPLSNHTLAVRGNPGKSGMRWIWHPRTFGTVPEGLDEASMESVREVEHLVVGG